MTMKEDEHTIINKLKEELLNKKSSLNLYVFKKQESLSREKILYNIRGFFIALDDNINYDKFIDIIINHFNLRVIEPCDFDEFCGIACKDFLIDHFENKDIVDLSRIVQYSKDAKDFKKRILMLMKNNITHFREDANCGSTGINKDGFHSFYHGSLFVNDFSVEISIIKAVCEYKNIQFSKMIYNRHNYWEKLYYYLLSSSGATLF